ncbi:MAG: hypothetical protein JOY66_08340 [Acetobacteraceae bacterium]|nr:hypothetical protein [Acetobacteraceae bacterium]
MARGKPLLPDDLDLDALRAPPGAAPRPPFLHEQAEPPSASAPPPPSPDPVAGQGLKDRAVATTLYLLPADHVRLRRMALERNVSFQTLMLDAIDMLLDRQGEPPVRRWETRRKVR